jgi:hypothetical protein
VLSRTPKTYSVTLLPQAIVLVKTKLPHTFAGDNPNYRIGKGTTNNLMDYPSVGGQGGTNLVRAQWGMAHSPAIFTPPQDDEDGAQTQDDFIAQICKSILSNGENGCGFVRYKNESGTTGDNIKFDRNTIEYLAGKYVSEEIVIVNGVGQPADADAVEKLKNKIKDGVFEFIVYVKPNGQIGICTPQEDYKMYSPSLLDFALDPGFLQKFKTDYLNCYNRSNIYNFTSETITEEQTEWLDKLYKGESQITQNGETYRTTSAIFIYTNETTSDTDKQFAETFTPSSGEVKIWVNKKNGKLEFKSAIPDFAAEATGLTKTQVKEQIINKIFDDYTASLQGWDQVASVLYEFFDLTRKKVRYFRVPERFWNCNDNEIYKPWLHVTIRHFIAPVRDNGSKYKSMAGAALEYEFKQAFPGLKDAIEGLDEPEAEFAFYCGIWNGVVEVVATVPDFLAFVTGALSADVVDDFRQTLIALNRYEGEDGKTGMWAAMENGLYQSVNGNCKLAELSGEIVFIVALAAVNPAALNRVQALAGPALANIIRVLKAFDAVADALPGYAIKFATNGAASFFDGGRLVARAVDGSFTGKALRISDNAIVDLPPHKLTDNLPTANNGKIEIEISGQKYRLISKVEADIIELLKTVNHSIDATTIAKSRTALGSIANDLSDIQIEEIIKKNYLASGKEYLKNNFPLNDEHLITLRSELQKISFQKGKPPIGHDMTKILHPDLLENIEGGAKFIPVHPDYRTVTGYVGRAEDFKGGNIDQVMKDYRLDYGGNNRYLAAKGKEKGYAVVRYKNTAGELDIPTNTNDGLPNTKTGMVGNDSRVIFEYKYKNETGRPYENGDILEYFDKDGVSKGQYRYGANDTNEIGWNLIE